VARVWDMCHLGQDCLIDSIFPCTSLPTLPLTAFLFLFRLRTKKVNPLFPKMRTTLASATGLLFAVVTVNADVYMHNPRGSNNRLNERSANRNNGNRMFDSQVRHHLSLPPFSLFIWVRVRGGSFSHVRARMFSECGCSSRIRRVQTAEGFVSRF
jgi:hypothetical protein